MGGMVHVGRPLAMPGHRGRQQPLARSGYRGIGVTVNARGVEEIVGIVTVSSTGWFVVARIPTAAALLTEIALPGQPGAEKVAQALVAALQEPCSVAGTQCQLGVSIGGVIGGGRSRGERLLAQAGTWRMRMAVAAT